jgi:hypothetical protein
VRGYGSPVAMPGKWMSAQSWPVKSGDHLDFNLLIKLPKAEARPTCSPTTSTCGIFGPICETVRRKSMARSGSPVRLTAIAFCRPVLPAIAVRAWQEPGRCGATCGRLRAETSQLRPQPARHAVGQSLNWARHSYAERGGVGAYSRASPWWPLRLAWSAFEFLNSRHNFSISSTILAKLSIWRKRG